MQFLKKTLTLILLAFSLFMLRGISAIEAYDQVFPTVKLRYGYGYKFTDTFNNGTNTKVGLDRLQVSFTEEFDFNGGTNPSFPWTQGIKNKGYILNPGESFLITRSTPVYNVRYHPVTRKSNNIEVVYTTTNYEYRGGSWKNKTIHTEYQPYTITWCGDGVVDNYRDPSGTQIREVCDPGDIGNKKNWGTGGCDNSCNPVVLPTPPSCTELDVKPTVGNIPLISNMSCTGENANSYKIVIKNGSTIIHTINGKTGTYNFSSEGNYTAQCYVNDTVTSNSCVKTINAETSPIIKVDKRDANTADIDGNVGNDTQTVAKGNKAVFKITVTNTGTEKLRNVVLTDPVEASCNRTAAQTVSYITARGNRDAVFDPGENFTYQCEKTNTQANYTNTINVSGIGVTSGTKVGDSDPTNVILEEGVLDLIKIKAPGQSNIVEPGDTVNYIIKVRNNSNVTITNQKVEDHFPEGLTLAHSDWFLVPPDQARVARLRNNIASIAPKQVLEFDISFTVDAGVSGTLRNLAVVCDASDAVNDTCPPPEPPICEPTDPDCCPNDTAEEGNPEGCEVVSTKNPSIKIDKTDANPDLDQDSVDGNDTQKVNSGEKAIFKIRVTNDGTEDLDTIVLTDAVAPNCAGSVSLPGTYPSTWSAFTTGGTGNKTDTVLEPNEWFEYTCEKSNTQSNYTNTAGVTAKGVDSDEQVNDDDDTLVVIVDSPSTPSSSGGTYKCQSATQSGSTVTCKGNSRVDSFYLKCGSNIVGPKNSESISGQHQATFNCNSSVFQCYVYNRKNAPIEGKVWRTSSACLVQDQGSHCGNGIIETNGGEQCDLGAKNTNSSNNAAYCNTSCEIVMQKCKDGKKPDGTQCVLTWPNGGGMIFKLDARSIIGHLQDPLEGMGSISLTNDSDYDMAYDKFCVKRTASDDKSGEYALSSGNPNGEYCANIAGDVIYAYETITLSDYGVTPDYSGNKKGISGSNYGDATLTASVKVDGRDYYNAYFAKKTDIRVSKPAIATTGGGTSYVKASTTADVAKVTGGKSGYTDNSNFVGTSVGDDAVSSYTQEVTDTQAIDAAVEENEEYKEAIDEVTQTTDASATNVSVTGYSNFSPYNGLDNVFIITGKDITLGALPAVTESTTYIVEGGNLTLTQDIITDENIAFVVKNGDIIVKGNVKHMDGTYISIPVGGNGGKIIAEESGEQLVVRGSLYGNIDDLVSNRYYISEDDNQLGVGTIVSFGSSLFSKPAPLVSQFVGEYLQSEKVAK